LQRMHAVSNSVLVCVPEWSSNSRH
jgi:hypothetical protein